MMATARAARVEIVERRTLHREAHAYCAHPHLAVATDGVWLLVFNRTLRRNFVLHPPQDPEYRNLLMRSEDEGRTWSAPAIVPGYGWSGVECAGLTALRTGRVLLNQWRFDWLPLPLAERLGMTGMVGPETLMAGLAASAEIGDLAPLPDARGAAHAFPWARAGGGTWVHHSDDGGASFHLSRPIDTAPFSGGYGMRGAIELPDGDIVLPLSDVPNYRAVFVVRSRDGGESWSAPDLVAAAPGHEFEEPAGLLLPSGRLLLMLRDNGSRILHQVHSDDGGSSWSRPEPTGIGGYPPQLLSLADDSLGCIVGQRRPPYGIVLHHSQDRGVTWEVDRPSVLVDDLPGRDLGYPSAALRANGELVAIYYGRDGSGVTGIDAVTVRLR
jgi:hypothetical protein